MNYLKRADPFTEFCRLVSAKQIIFETKNVFDHTCTVSRPLKKYLKPPKMWHRRRIPPNSYQLAPQQKHPVSGLTMAELWEQFDRSDCPMQRVDLDLDLDLDLEL